MGDLGVVLLLRVEAADIIFLSLALLFGVVIVLISNPLTSWVNWLLKEKRTSRPARGIQAVRT